MKSSPHAEPAADVELTIGELADHFGLATHVLRHWEAAGLLAPTRVNGRRRYDRDSVTRVAIIRHGKQVGLSLDQLRALLSTAQPAERRVLLDHHRAELRRRIAHAEASLRVLDHAVRCPDFMTCPELHRMAHELPEPAPGEHPGEPPVPG